MKDTLLRYGWLPLLALLALATGQAAAQTTTTPPTTESFETGTKTTYPTGVVTLSTGDWTFDDALLGTDPTDHKNGSQAVRVEQQGRLTMNFYLPGGASLVTVQHAVTGNDAGSGWELWAQSQSCTCNNWTKVGATVLATSSALQTAAFSVSLPGAVRFELRKVSGGAARLNFDDFTVTPYGTQATGYPDNDHLALGNPSNATSDVNFPTNFLLEKPQYKVSYNRDQGKPNWVSWHLDASWVGSAPRQDDFRPDSTLPLGWYRVLATDYQGTGFDRGHNCPSADRTSSIRNNSMTFLMSNMMPQAPNNNQQTWANLENYTRTFLGTNEVYVIAGSYGIGGVGSASTATITTIAGGKITVPARCWKVVVILPIGNNDVLRVNANTRIIAVDMPNNNLSTSWGTYRTTVDAIENATGYDLLSALPAAVQAAVESQVDTGPTQ